MEARVLRLTCTPCTRTSPTSSSSSTISKLPQSLCPSLFKPMYPNRAGSLSFIQMTWYLLTLFSVYVSFFKNFLLGFSWPVLARSSSNEDQLLEGLPKEYYDDVSGCLCSISYVVYFRLTGSKLENESFANLLIRVGKAASFLFYSQTHERFSLCTTKSLIASVSVCVILKGNAIFDLTVCLLWLRVY